IDAPEASSTQLEHDGNCVIDLLRSTFDRHIGNGHRLLRDHTLRHRHRTRALGASPLADRQRPPESAAGSLRENGRLSASVGECGLATLIATAFRIGYFEAESRGLI